MIGTTPLISFDVGPWQFILTKEGLLDGGLIASRVLGSVSVIVVLCMVTPAGGIFAALRWARLPRTWIELAMLMYRYIFTLFEQATSVLSAQKIRLGYAGLRRSLRSMGNLGGIVLLRSIDQAEKTHEAMVARGYEGLLPMPTPPALRRRDLCLLGGCAVGHRAGLFPGRKVSLVNSLNGELAIQADGVSYAYPDGIEALADLSFHAAPGEFVAVMGANGAGKTTLMKVLMRLLQPQKGEVRLGDRNIAALRPAELYRPVGMVFQNPADQLFAASVEEDVAFGPRNLGLPEAEVAERVDEALAAVDAVALRDRPIHHLSFGEQKRVCLAGVLAMRPAILVLDEPIAGLDPVERIAHDRAALAAEPPTEDHHDPFDALGRPAAGAGRSHLRAGQGPRAAGRPAGGHLERPGGDRPGRPAAAADRATVPRAGRRRRHGDRPAAVEHRSGPAANPRLARRRRARRSAIKEAEP